MTALLRGCVLTIAVALQLDASGPLALTGRQAAPSTNTPRMDHAVGLYDEGLRRVVLIGAVGNPSDGDRDAVWGWSGTRWEIVTERGPEGRVNASAAYEARRQRSIVAGGSRRAANNGAWRVVGDAWASDATGWQRVADLDPRDHHSLVEDGRGGILMFGGIPANRREAWPADTWELRTEGWARLATEGPAARGRSALVHDGKRNQIVLFGGVSAPAGPDQSQTFFGDTWIWNGERWRKAAETGPRGRYAHGMVFDERAGVVLLYSGAAAHKGAPLSDMWQWDGERWTEILLTGPTPGHRYQPVMVYDRARGRTVLYGGIGGTSDTWEWDGRAWQQMTP